MCAAANFLLQPINNGAIAKRITDGKILFSCDYKIDLNLEAFVFPSTLNLLPYTRYL